ncbi:MULTISPECIES: TonB-dependent receptor domain-containing protein [Sphingobium]|uniref:TonB-dependent receptor domain-containing protein n=1 Tax=Sphingobium TaxID=165695 RepID=UPI00159C7DD6|nr:TonB-dependent receptor [Sphingobium sp. 15-1]
MNTKNYAAFVDLNYDLGPLTLIAGARLSHEKSRGTFERGLPRDGAPAEGGPDMSLFLPGSAIAGYTPLSVASSVKYDHFSWRAGAQYHVAPDIMIYATAYRAYKGPGFNFAADLTPAVFAQTQSIVDPEIAHSYEVGLRTQFFDRQVTFNVTGYYAPYKDFQITAALPGTGGNGLTYTIINAGGIHAKGIETEFAFNPRGALGGFSISGDLTWNDTKYSDFTNAPCYALQPRSATPGVCAAPSMGSTASVQSVNGFRTVGNPEWKTTASSPMIWPSPRR